MQENKVLELKVKQTKKTESKKDEDEKIEASSYNEEDMISKYVEQSKTELDKEFLVKVGKKICETQAS